MHFDILVRAAIIKGMKILVRYFVYEKLGSIIKSLFKSTNIRKHGICIHLINKMEKAVVKRKCRF